jgi:hypothetical protein
MFARFDFIVVVIMILWVALGLWAASIAYVYWDSSRRALSGRQQLTWVLVSLLPFAGAIIYLLMRPLPDSAAGQPPRRVTLIKRRPAIMRELPTIVAADHERLAHLRQVDLDEPVTLTPQEIAGQGSGAARPAVNQFQLRVLDGPHAGEQFHLPVAPAVVGRGPDCTICLEKDIGVSRHHVEFYRQQGQLWLRDLDSRHGTVVNGRTVQTTALQPGDQIQLGQSTLTLDAQEEQR